MIFRMELNNKIFFMSLYDFKWSSIKSFYRAPHSVDLKPDMYIYLVFGEINALEQCVSILKRVSLLKSLCSLIAHGDLDDAEGGNLAM